MWPTQSLSCEAESPVSVTLAGPRIGRKGVYCFLTASLIHCRHRPSPSYSLACAITANLDQAITRYDLNGTVKV